MSASDKQQPVRLGLLGLGTVGTGVVEILHKHGALIAARTGIELVIQRALVRNPRRRRSGPAGKIPLVRSPDAVIGAPDIDVVVELIGGREPALSYVLAALSHGQPVVTANKAILAADGTTIFRAAAKAHQDVYFEAAVAGGIPIIRTLREGLASDRITEIVGILNGTTNFILEEMGRGADYAVALREAQRLGFAEADPSRDIGGNDAADKLAILAHLAYGTVVAPDQIPTVGITDLTPEVLADADQLGYRVKLLGIARRVDLKKRDTCLDLRVHPAFVRKGHALASVPAAQNAIAVTSDSLGPTFYQGAGAGALPTGSAVVADLIEVARNLRAGINGRVTELQQKTPPRPIPYAKSESAYYLRLLVQERPGVLAAVTRIFARNKISLATVIQKEPGGDPARAVPVVLTTHSTTAGAMQKALRSIQTLRAMRGSPKVVRIDGVLPEAEGGR